MRGVSKAGGAAIALLVAVGMLLAAPAASAAWRAIPPPGSEALSMTVANATTWLVERPSVCCTRQFDLTEDGGASWTPVEVAGFVYAFQVGAADDGSFRVVATSGFGPDEQEVQVLKIAAGGAVEPLGPSIAVEAPPYDGVAVSGDGATWVPHWDEAAGGFVLSIVAADGSLTDVPLPDSASTYGWKARRTVAGMRLLRYRSDSTVPYVYSRGTFRLGPGNELLAAERYPLSMASGDWLLSSDGYASWDGGAHWSTLFVRAVETAPAGQMPRYVSGSGGFVAERFSPFLFRTSGLEPPPTEWVAGVVDAGTALIAWWPHGIYVHEGALPPPPQALGELQPDTVRLLDRANAFRADAGLPPLIGDALVSAAARSHSTYTVLNESSSDNAHYEYPGRPGFTGSEPWDRCEAAGTTCNSEVMYPPGVADPVGGWLATIFHRPLLGGPEAGVVGAAEVPGGWTVANGRETRNLLVAPFGYPNGRWRGDASFSGEVPDPVKGCAEAGQPIDYPVGAAVSLYLPTEFGSVSRIVVHRRGIPGPLPGCLLHDYVGDGKFSGVFLPDDPLVPGATYDATATWNPGPDEMFGAPSVPSADLTYSWSFYFDPDKLASRRSKERRCRALGLRTIKSVAKARRGKARHPQLGIEEKIVLKQKASVRLRHAGLTYWTAGTPHPVKLELGRLRRKPKVVGRTSYLRLSLPQRVVREVEPGEEAELRLKFTGRRLKGCRHVVHISRIRKIKFGWVRLRGSAAWVSAGSGKRRR
ncbi:MAG TPA: hypothetical protein VN733_08495 [Solirubrobacterales bacterium]|nr:hypothetical protein [Solirubrobacterales bacterium]